MRLKNFIDRKKGWVMKCDLEDYARALGYLADNGARRLRELAEDSLINRKLEGKGRQKLVWYKKL